MHPIISAYDYRKKLRDLNIRRESPYVAEWIRMDIKATEWIDFLIKNCLEEREK